MSRGDGAEGLRLRYPSGGSGRNQMVDAMKRLLDEARAARMTPADREAQRRSFAYGNTAFENPLITREMVDREADRLAQGEDDAER